MTDQLCTDLRQYLPLESGEAYCDDCHQPFLPQRASILRCDRCRRARSIRQRQQSVGLSFSLDLGINTAKAGALGELLAAADLVARGYHVYRAVAPDAPCDLIALKDTECYRVEVRIGRRGADGVLRFPYKAKDADRQDLIAIVCTGEPVAYRIPDTAGTKEHDDTTRIWQEFGH